MASYKKQHYLAQSYLLGFADRKRQDATIWQYRKSTNELRLKGIGNVAYGNRFYSTQDSSGAFDHSREQWFSTIESKWPALRKRFDSNRESISRLNAPKRITYEDRATVIRYMLIQ